MLAAIEETGIGDVAAAEKLADVVGRASLDGRPVDGTTSVESNKVLMRAIMCRSGAADMLESASRVVELEGPGSGWRNVALWILANARLLAGDLDGADASLADAVAAAAAGHNAGTLQVALGQRALLAIDRGDWSAAAAFAREAGTVVASAHLDDYQITACTAAALARIAVHRGDIRAATDELTRAVVLRPQLTATLPWLNVLALLSLARAHLAVSDPGGAQTLLAQARDVIRLRPDLGTLPAQVVALQAELNERPIGLAGASSLTAAELRVLQFLPLYLSFKEIGERLDVKASTVQTHAVAIYGKLGASSRSEAVDLAIAARLLEAPTNWATTSHHAWDAKRLEG
jgi:LuxR family maltose regulon positive regulatory protein